MKRVVVGIISRNSPLGEKQYLLMSSKHDFGKYTGLYYPPGGHIEEGENEKSSLIREIREELGIEIVPIERIAETPGDIPEQTTYWWSCQPLTNDINLKIKSDEVLDARWFLINEIKKSSVLWPSTREFFEEYIF